MVKRLDTDRAWRDLWEQVKARSVKSDNPARYMVLQFDEARYSHDDVA